MSFLDEEVVTTDDPNKAEQLAKKGVKVNLVDKVSEKKGRDLDGDGDVDSDDYLAARDAAIKKAKAKKKVNEENLEEGKLSRLLAYLGIGAAALVGLKKLDDSDPVINAINTAYEKGLVDTDDEKKWAKDALLRRGVYLQTGKGEGGDLSVDDVKDNIKEDKQIKVDANQKFVIDLKHLLQKHGKENTIKITKKLMKQLHDKGEVEVDGTKLLFKEADVPQDTSVDLPEPKSNDFLGPDGKDYEGGMAKAQMLKMKKYAMALCDMVDDETQLEAWVQSKITKASDYMSSVYHYLDYQQTKMNEAYTLNGREVEDIEIDGGEFRNVDPYVTSAVYADTGKPLTDDELDALIDKYNMEPGSEFFDQYGK